MPKQRTMSKQRTLPRQRNVLWMMSDQHHANSTGYAGDPNVRTPCLDALAADAVNFRQAFTVNPICPPFM